MNLLRKQPVSLSAFAPAAIIVLVVNHVIGVAGLNNPAGHEVFERLSNINLLLGFFLVLLFHTPVNRNLFWFCVFSFTVGMMAEIAGVNTGYPFGSYSYTPTFGRQVYGVPVIIGINWILLSYVTGVAVNNVLHGGWQKILAASALMVAIDLLLERFAIRHHFWIWRDKVPPVQNYISWFIISIVIQFAFRKLIPASINRNAIAYLVILFVFLITDSLLSLFYLNP